MSRSKFTAATRADLIKYLEAGSVVATACRMAGIHPTQFYRWIKRGEDAQRSSSYRRFYEDVQRATAKVEVRAMTILQKAMSDDPKWAAWYLERRVPEFSTRDRVEVTGSDGGPLVVRLEWAPGPVASEG